MFTHPKPQRMCRDQFFMELATSYSHRSTCPRLMVGAVVVGTHGTAIGLGYNGAPRGLPHCTDVGCDVVGDSCQRSVHAEVNALCEALLSSKGNLLEGCTLYVTHFPCRNCFNLAANLRIGKIIYGEEYKPLQSVLDNAKSLNMEVEHFTDAKKH